MASTRVRTRSAGGSARGRPSLDPRAAKRRGGYAYRLVDSPPAAVDVDETERAHRFRHYARCIALRPEPECPETDGWWAVSDATGMAIPRSCKRWTCGPCRRVKRMPVLVALQHGVSLARENGQRVRHLVLTDKDGTLDMDGFYRAFTKRLVPRLRRGGYLADYAVALETQPDSGRLHGHVLLIEPAFIGPLREGERRPSTGRGFIPKPLLDRMAAECGFGWAFIREVRDIPAANASLVDYFVKGVGGDHSVPSRAVGEIGTYMSKAHEMARLSGFANKRLRPFRVSAGWPLNLTNATEQLRREMFGEPAPGPWVMVWERDCDPWLSPLRARQRIERERSGRWERVRALESLALEAGREPARFGRGTLDGARIE